MDIEIVVANMAMEMLALRRELDELKLSGVKTTGTGAGRAIGVKCLDTKTGVPYRSHSSAGIAVAPEFGLAIHSRVWYEVLLKAGEARFQDITDDEYTKLIAEQKAKAETKEPEKVGAKK